MVKISSFWMYFIVILSQLFVQTAFGSYGVILKAFAQTADINPLVFSFFRDLCSSPILLITAYFLEKTYSKSYNNKNENDIELNEIISNEEFKEEEQEEDNENPKHYKFIRIPKGKEWILFIILGLLGMFGNQLFYIQGVYFTNASIAAMFQPLIPIIAAILAIITFTDPFPSYKKITGWLMYIGIISAVIGSFFILASNNIENSDTDDTTNSLFLGCLCLLGNTSSMACYIVAQKRFVFFCKDIEYDDNDNIKLNLIDKYCTQIDKNDNTIKGIFHDWSSFPITTTAWSYVFGAILIGLSSIYYIIVDRSVFTSIDSQIILPLCYSVFITSSLCYGLLTFGNKYLSSTVVTSFWPFQIFIAVSLSYILFGDILVLKQWIGCIFILLGLACVTYSDHKSKHDKQIIDNNEDNNEDNIVNNE